MAPASSKSLVLVPDLLRDVAAQVEHAGSPARAGPPGLDPTALPGSMTGAVLSTESLTARLERVRAPLRAWADAVRGAAELVQCADEAAARGTR